MLFRSGIYHYLLEPALGTFGSALLLGATYCGALMFILVKDVGAEVEKLLASFAAWREERARQQDDRRELLRREQEERAKAAKLGQRATQRSK